MYITHHKTDLREQICPICQSERVINWGKATDIGDGSTLHTVWKCRNCRHHWVFSAKNVGNGYSTQDKSFYPDASFFENRARAPLTDGETWALDHIMKRSVKPGSMLDIGPGRPAILKKFVSQGWDVYAIEPTRHADDIAREAGCTVYRCMFEDSRFPRKFDVIIALDVLEHSSDPIRFIGQIQANLANGGIALFRFPNSSSLRCRINRETWEMLRPLGHLQYFSPTSFNLACSQFGLQVSQWTTRDLYGYRGLNLPFLSSSVKHFRVILDDLGLGDQILGCVSHGKDSRRLDWSIYRNLKVWRPNLDHWSAV